MRTQMRPRDKDQRNLPNRLLRLRIDLTLHVVPARADPDHVRIKVDLVHPERTSLATPQTLEEVRSPQRLIFIRHQ